MITTEKTLQIDKNTVIEGGTIEIDSYTVKPSEKSIRVTCIFTSGTTVAIRDIGVLKYSSTWSLEDIENYIEEQLEAKEVKTESKR